ncbi:MAG: leucyl aminopeptidase [Bdellovibrio sp.]|nr:MAG: leucyl aminopeptidase [Bdellovibrio sp.]
MLSKKGVRPSSQVSVYFSFQKKKGEQSTTHVNSSAVQKLLKNSIDAKIVTGKAKEAVLFRETQWEGVPTTLVVGLGSELTHESYRQAAATVLKSLKTTKCKDANIILQDTPAGDSDHSRNLLAFVEGLYLANYKYDELKTKKNDSTPEGFTLHLVSGKTTDRKADSLVNQAKIIAESVNLARRLGDTPGNLMTPRILADEAVAAAQSAGAKATVWDKKRIEKEKMGGLFGVAQGSHQEPRFIILEYRGTAASKKPVVLVGKGLTFDSGGISLKPGASMEEMKFDKCGGCNVIGAFLAAARLKLKVNLVALIPSSENMPGGAATKPGDVHRARNGKTFEVNNTDAEGRLILADALCYASELQPVAIFDAATLTGAMVVALGNVHSGYFTRNDQLSGRIQKASALSGELVWRMPLTDAHVEDMKGTYADLSNVSAGKGAGSATAAAFLEQFVEKGIPWAHFDIAGTAWSLGGRLNYCASKGASGSLVRTFVELARSYE